MNSDKSVPTTERVRTLYSHATGWSFRDLADRPDLLKLRVDQGDEFDRWLAAHDAALLSRVAQPEVWIVVGQAGEWSDYTTWCEGVCSTEALALAEVDRLTDAELVERTRDRGEEENPYYDYKSYHMGGKYPVDPNTREAGA